MNNNTENIVQKCSKAYISTFDLYTNFRNSYSPKPMTSIHYYSDVSFIKMSNLAKSTIVLISQGFSDEALIIIRTMYEHLINYIYIFRQNSQSEEEINEKINKFLTYQELLPYYRFCNNSSDEQIKDKVKKFKELYKNPNHWSGNSFSNFHDKTLEKCNLDDNKKTELYNIYKKCCLFSHPTLLNYTKLNKNVFQVTSFEDSIFQLHYIYTLFLGIFFKIFYLKNNNLSEYQLILNSLSKTK